MPRRYTDAEAIDFATKAAMIGTVRQASERLGVPASTLRGWLRWQGWGIRQGRIFDRIPPGEPMVPLKSGTQPADTPGVVPHQDS